MIYYETFLIKRDNHFLFKFSIHFVMKIFKNLLTMKLFSTFVISFHVKDIFCISLQLLLLMLIHVQYENFFPTNRNAKENLV